MVQSNEDHADEPYVRIFLMDVGGLQVKRMQLRILEGRLPVQQASSHPEHLLAAARGQRPSPAVHLLCSPARALCLGWVVQAR